MAKKQKRDVLSEDELQGFLDRGSLLEAGKPYLFTMSFGWAIVGFYVRHLNATTMLIAHANHFAGAGKHYGLIASEGITSQDAWRYEGLIELSTLQRLKTQEYFAEVPRAAIRVG